MSRVLITGATGYIGGYLVPTLIEAGYEIVTLSRHSNQQAPSGVISYKGDVRDYTSVLSAMRGCDFVVHLACAPVGRSVTDPLADFHVNALGTLHVLQAAQEMKVRNVVYTSSAEVLGRPSYLPIDEMHPTLPCSPYGASKLCGEIYCQAFNRVYGLHSIILRLFNVYGAPSNDQPRGTVEMIFAYRALSGQPLIILGHRDKAKDFVHIRDVVQAIKAAIEREGEGQIINIGSGRATTLGELARIIIALTGQPVISVVQGPSTDPLRYQADIQRARDLLGWSPRIPLKEGLAEVVEWAKQHKELGQRYLDPKDGY